MGLLALEGGYGTRRRHPARAGKATITRTYGSNNAVRNYRYVPPHVPKFQTSRFLTFATADGYMGNGRNDVQYCHKMQED